MQGNDAEDDKRLFPCQIVLPIAVDWRCASRTAEKTPGRRRTTDLQTLVALGKDWEQERAPGYEKDTETAGKCRLNFFSPLTGPYLMYVSTERCLISEVKGRVNGTTCAPKFELGAGFVKRRSLQSDVKTDRLEWKWFEPLCKD